MNTQKLRKKECLVLDKVFTKIRQGHSLYAACLAEGLSTRKFYQLIAADARLKDEFFMALSDYADQCTDDIRSLAESLKAGEIDNSTAKLLIETTKWLAQKACPEPFNMVDTEDDEKLSEIVVKFVS